MKSCVVEGGVWRDLEGFGGEVQAVEKLGI